MLIQFNNAFNTNIKVGDKVIFEIEVVKNKWFNDGIFKVLTQDHELIATLYVYQNHWCGNEYTVSTYKSICNSKDYFISAITGIGEKKEFKILVQPTKFGISSYFRHVKAAERDMSSFRTFKYGDFSYYRINDKCLVLKGFKNSKNSLNVLKFQEKRIKTLFHKFMGDGSAYYVDGVGANAFKQNEHLREIDGYFDFIGENCFRNCKKLDKIKVTTHLCHSSAFKGCDSLREVYGILLFISEEAFMNCSNLKTVSISSDYISERAFMNCVNLVNVKLGEDYTKAHSTTYKNGEKFIWIGESAFEGCLSMETIDLSASNLSIISSRTFANCKNLKTVVFPRTINSIDNEAFLNCENLEELHFKGSVFRIGENAFANCSKLKMIRFDREVLTISKNAFSNCENIEKVIMPSWKNNEDITLQKILSS